MNSSGFKLGLEQLDKYIDRTRLQLEKQRELMAAIGEVLVAGTVDRFSEQEDPDGKQWIPSKYSRKGKLLMGTARLRNSITHKEEGFDVYVGTNLIYAGTHQNGAEIMPKKAKALAFNGSNGKKLFRKKVTIPQRKFLGISKTDKEDIADLIREILELGGNHA